LVIDNRFGSRSSIAWRLFAIFAKNRDFEPELKRLIAN